MTKPNIAVIFGGRSAEHDVSIITGVGSVAKPLELSGKFNVLPVYISKQGLWYSDPALMDVQLFTSGKIDNFLKKAKPLSLKFDNGLFFVKEGSLSSKKTKVDIVFPAMHGTYGEDGSLMGVLRMADVPFVGCDMAASAVAMDKVLCKQVISSEGLPTPKSVWFTKQDFNQNSDSYLKKCEALSYPLFVKPAHLGSSIGISRVKNSTELKNGIEVALHYDDKVLVEEGVNNLIEVTVPVMGNHDIKAAMVEESLQDKEGFFDFDTKYIGQDGKKGKKGKSGESSVSRIPAKISDDLYKECERLAKETFRVIGGSGLARIDLLIDSKANKVYVNEVNTLPGFLYNHNWRHAGLSNVELVLKLVDLAMERYEEQSALTTVFDTNYLKQF